MLMMLNVPWQRDLGAAQPQMALADEFRGLGVEVEKWDYRDAFPMLSRFRHSWMLPMQKMFPRRAVRFARREGRRFDIIDAQQGNLPRTKRALGYSGLLVARSVGLDAMYDEFNRRVRRRLPPARGLRRLKNLARAHFTEAGRSGPWPNVAPSLAAADLINVPNPDERDCIRGHYRLQTPCLVQPFGLTPAHRRELAGAARPAGAAAPTVAFIGSWDARKGNLEWPEIVRRVRQEMPAAGFRFLGTLQARASVFRDLGLPEETPGIEVEPRFDPEELPARLAGVALGAFPSHLEGFGIAVIEMMAAGLPVVAYDAPGPRTTLAPFAGELLAPAGDAAAFAARLLVLLRDEARRAALGEACRREAERYDWPRIARETLAAYEEALARVNARP